MSLLDVQSLSHRSCDTSTSLTPTSQTPPISTVRLPNANHGVLCCPPAPHPKRGQRTGTNSNQPEVEQLCDDPCSSRVVASSALCPAQPRGHLSGLTEPPAPRHTCPKQTGQLSAVVSRNHSCRTQKKLRDGALGTPRYHNHTIEASPPHSFPTSPPKPPRPRPVCSHPVSFSHCHSSLKLSSDRDGNVCGDEVEAPTANK